MGVPDPLAAAVAENALWCDQVGRAAGNRTAVDARHWWSSARMPPLHPDAVSLVPGIAADEMLAGLDVGPGCSVKDSHADVDLAAAGWEVVLSGRWWHRPPGHHAARSTLRVTTHGASDPAVRTVVVADGSGRTVARAVLHDAGEVVGLSNLTADAGSEAEAWRAVVAVASGRHLVGWEPDDDLASATAAGCEPLGPLRVWRHPGPPQP